MGSMRHFLQSQAWGAFQEALGKEVISRAGAGWSYLAVLENTGGRASLFQRRLYLPYGPTARDKASFEVCLSDVLNQAAEKSAVFVRIEPVIESGEQIDLKRYGGHLKKWYMQPDRTLLLDLTIEENELLSGMSGTNRNLWNTHKKKGITFKKSYDQKDMPAFLRMIHAVAIRKDLIQHEDAYYLTLAKTLFPTKKAGLAFAELHGKPIVAAMFFDDTEAGVRYYAHAGSLDEARKVQANSPLLTYLILDAKKNGMTTFDFYGVAPEGDDNYRGAGHSKFKRSFGGVDRVYFGTWEFPVKPARHLALRLARRLRN